MADGKIPITDAKRIAVERRCPIVVIFGIESGGDRFCVTSYGMTRKLCKLGAAYADQIADAVLGGKVVPPQEEPPDEPEVAQLREGLRRIAARCEDWSAQDVRANVADLLGVKVEELDDAD